MKKSFAAKAFASRTFKSGNWTGVGVEAAQVLGYRTKIIGSAGQRTKVIGSDGSRTIIKGNEQ